MSRNKKSHGEGRGVKKSIYIPPSIAAKAAHDLETGRFNDKVNAFLEVSYNNGGQTDSLTIQIAEVEAILGREQARLASLRLQQSTAQQVMDIEAQSRRQEEVLAEHIRTAAGLPHPPAWKTWLHPGRIDVKAVGGMGRAKQILKEITGVNL